MANKIQLAIAHNLIAQAMGVPQMSVEAEQKLTTIARAAAAGLASKQ